MRGFRYLKCQLIVSNRKGLSCNRDQYFKENLMTKEYRFLISDLNLHLPVLESIYCNLFFRVMHWTTYFSPWGIFHSSNLRSQSARTIVKLFRGRMSAFDKSTFLSLEGTRGNQQMKGKLMKLLAQKIISTSTALIGHSLSRCSTCYPICWQQATS